jgi:hypothetical protein
MSSFGMVKTKWLANLSKTGQMSGFPMVKTKWLTIRYTDINLSDYRMSPDIGCQDQMV